MSIATELTRIQTAKANLKTQIEAKGVSVPSTATIDTYATYVQAIPQGGGGGGTDYFKITNRTATAGTIAIKSYGRVDLISHLNIKTSSDGTNWTSYTISGDTNITLPANGYVLFDGSENYNPWGISYTQYWHILVDVDYNVSGKLFSLNAATPGIRFDCLFKSDTHLIDASQLDMSTNIVTDRCYEYMFHSCTGLTTAPALPATNLGNYCYRSMFQDCTSLATAPALPATTMVTSCYEYMFNNCTSLTTAPELPASALALSCYSGMFYGCTGLTTAPLLSASALTNNCYKDMFRDCTSLTSITCLAMTTANANATAGWVIGIQTTGTLYVASGNSMNWAQGNNGYPSTWNMETYTEPTSGGSVNITITGATSACIGDDGGGCKPYSSITFNLYNESEGESSAFAILENTAYMPDSYEVMWELVDSGITREVTSITYDDTTDTLTFTGEFDTGSTHLVKCMTTELNERFLYKGEAIDGSDDSYFDGSTSVTLTPYYNDETGPLRTLTFTGVTFPSDEGETTSISDNDKFYVEMTWNSVEMTYDTSNSWLSEDWFTFDFDDTEGEVRITANWTLYSDGGEYTVESKFEEMGQCIDSTQQSLQWDDDDEFEKTMTFEAGTPCAEDVE